MDFSNFNTSLHFIIKYAFDSQIESLNSNLFCIKNHK